MKRRSACRSVIPGCARATSASRSASSAPSTWLSTFAAIAGAQPSARWTAAAFCPSSTIRRNGGMRASCWSTSQTANGFFLCRGARGQLDLRPLQQRRKREMYDLSADNYHSTTWPPCRPMMLQAVADRQNERALSTAIRPTGHRHRHIPQPTPTNRRTATSASTPTNAQTPWNGDTDHDPHGRPHHDRHSHAHETATGTPTPPTRPPRRPQSRDGTTTPTATATPTAADGDPTATPTITATPTDTATPTGTAIDRYRHARTDTATPTITPRQRTRFSRNSGSRFLENRRNPYNLRKP